MFPQSRPHQYPRFNKEDGEESAIREGDALLRANTLDKHKSSSDPRTGKRTIGSGRYTSLFNQPQQHGPKANPSFKPHNNNQIQIKPLSNGFGI